ncbi:MAG TPA: polyprenyl synthetase family protein [candidate division Zixibacteria bacterium]|nr:polyprenyl synthetase family protein [candidate division Zixibacteria bacterium]
MDARLEQLLRPIAPQLEDFEKQFKTCLSARSPFVYQVTEHILTRRGKRLRPAFVFLSSGQMAADPQRAMLAALAVELIHTATLLHDDVIDVSSTRRGQPTVNSKWNNLVSVLMGDYLFSKAFRLLVQAESVDLVEAFSKATERVSVGQLVEIQHINNFDIGESDYFSLIADKTASLFAVSCEAGAILSGCPEREREKIREFGEKVGVAFQISDDLLDIVGTEAVTGKTVGNDLREGKVTLPLIYTLNNGGSPRKSEIISLLKNGSENGEVEKVARIVLESGGVEYAQKKALQCGQEAFELLSLLPATEFKQSLEEVARFAALREQ